MTRQGHKHTAPLTLSLVLLAVANGPSRLPAQDTGARLTGVVTDAAGQPLANVRITVSQPETGFSQITETDPHGQYGFASLPLGPYRLKAEVAGYRGREKQGELRVGDQKEENFTLQLLSGSEGQNSSDAVLGAIPPAPTLQAETIASSVSVVVDESNILQLPLESRNFYALFLLQPGVTSQGAIVRRGLSFSVHGQRVSGSNYLFDGVDNNDIVLTGPVALASADAVQEFRMIKSTFSAEYGRASSFVAQVVTRSGSNQFHGSVYEFLANDKLDANTFQNNSEGKSKSPFHHNQFGYFLGGPVQKNKRFFTSALEFSALRYRFPITLQLPTSTFIAQLPEGSAARLLLTEFPPIPSTPTAQNPSIGVASIQVPNRIDTLLATERFDQYSTSGKDRLMLRYSLASTTEQRSEENQFIGYPSLRPTDHFRAHHTVLGWNHAFDAGQVNDLRLGWSRERILQPRPRNDLPAISVTDPAAQNQPVAVPGSLLRLDQRENDNVIQVSDNFSVRRGRSALTLGVEYRRNLSDGITGGLENAARGGTLFFPEGYYGFNSLQSFAEGRPFSFSINVDRFSPGGLRPADLRRHYRSADFALFVQNDLKLSRRFSINVGLRYEYFGVPHNTDRSKDVNFYFGPGANILERLANGSLRSADQNPGDLKGLLYRPDHSNFAPSIGLAWDPFGRGRTVVRAGYAVAFDRLFDAIRDPRTNTQQAVRWVGCPSSFVISAQAILPLLSSCPQNLGPPAVVQIDENLRTPYAQNWYAGVQHNVTSSSLIELGHSGSVGRKLISRDQTNRQSANRTVLGDDFLSNSGNSNYLALDATLRRRFNRGLQSQISYTYSHAIDNQSDVLEGVRISPLLSPALATFTRQFDSRLDRGNANFDQRHNLVFNAIWDIPAAHFRSRWANQALGGWTTSVIGAYRSGFPVTVIGSTSPLFAPGLRNNRADYLGAAGSGAHTSIPGGVQWLDPSLFRPARDHVGNLGRGAIQGPGFWNYDFALLRNIPLKEGGLRLQFRAEFYNLFNHANLSAPVTLLTDPDFGQALYGLNRTFSRFGELPLENPARRIQLALRLQF